MREALRHIFQKNEPPSPWVRCLAWAVASAVVLVVLVGYGVFYEPDNVGVVRVEVPIAGLPEALDGFTIAQISDTHITSLGHRERRVIEILADLYPDLIAVTGDVIQSAADYAIWQERVVHVRTFLERLAAPYGAWVVLGNTDCSRYSGHRNLLVDAMRTAGARVLVNEAQALDVKGARLYLGGVEFASFYRLNVTDYQVVRDQMGNMIYRADFSLGNAYSHYWGQETIAWRDYEYRGRIRYSDAEGGMGVTFYSRFPEGYDRFYRLRRYADEPTLHIAPHGTRITGGDTDTGINPAENTWYRFRIQVESGVTRTVIRAKVWEEGTPEPDEWQVDCFDENETRLKSGTVGLWSLGPGWKFADDLEVVPLDRTDRLYWQENFNGFTEGADPLGWLDYGINKGNLALAVESVPLDEMLIVLAHSPDFVQEAGVEKVDLMLSGHTHGGQVRLPFLGAFHVPSSLGPQYSQGLFRFGETQLYVNRGLGWTGIPVRFLCQPEITLITLRQAAAQ
ncbi:MAG: hypothetical protein H5T64_00580 [Chloroflexi bacterium]|nr:hypothetical protein [Chloroflexota bacterium]